MRKYIVLSIVFIAALSSCNNIPKGLAYRWTFDEPDGKLAFEDVNSVADSIQYIFNQREPKSDPIRRNGLKGNSLEFDGFSSYIVRDASQFAFPESSFTISVWVAPRAFETFEKDVEKKLAAIINQQDLQTKRGFCLGISRHGHWSFQMGDGEQWYEIWDEGNAIPRRQWSFLTVSFNSETQSLSLYLNGSLISSSEIGANKVVAADQPLKIGQHNDPLVTGRNLLNMFNGLMDDLRIYSVSLSSEDINNLFNSYFKKEIPALTYDEIKIDRAKYKNDPYRPELHANPPGHWMNEPHAPFFYNGKYHLTYQHNPTGPYWHNIEWGHWVSEDLVHWKDMPEILTPEENDVAPDGIWSGSATFDKDGVPVMVYTFGNWNKERNQGVALAFPKDPSDPCLTEWVPLPHTTIEQQEGQGITGEFRDPFAWRDSETGKWYMIVGSGIPGKGGTAWAYESDNVLDWTYKGPFYLSNYEKYPFLGDKWELPVFLPLGKYENGETRYIMIVSPKGYLQNVEVYYWFGRFDKENVRFIPDDEEPLYWDYGGNRFIGPSGLIDQKGRALIFTVVGGNGAGWSGTCGFPSHIFMTDEGKLGVKPIEELSTLRTDELYSAENKTLQEVNSDLEAISGNMIEIYLEMDVADAEKAGIKVLKDPDGREETLFYYDSVNKKLLKDNSRSNASSTQNRSGNFVRKSTDQREELRNHFVLADGETLKMHLFVDKSLIQNYINDRNTITAWAYPSLDESKGIEVFAEGSENARIAKIQIWELGSIYY